MAVCESVSYEVWLLAELVPPVLAAVTVWRVSPPGLAARWVAAACHVSDNTCQVGGGGARLPRQPRALGLGAGAGGDAALRAGGRGAAVGPPPGRGPRHRRRQPPRRPPQRPVLPGGQVQPPTGTGRVLCIQKRVLI